MDCQGYTVSLSLKRPEGLELLEELFDSTVFQGVPEQ